MIYATKLLNADKKGDIAVAVALIQQGELVAVPTETVYGLAADAKNPNAVAKIFTAKNRPADHPLIVHIASLEKISEWAIEVPEIAYVLGRLFWPGPLTLLLKKAPWVSDVITGGLETIALRVPSSPALLEILRTLDTGVAAPSANPHKKISPTTAEHVMAGLSGKIAAVLDGGTCSVGLESTILDVTTSQPRILRPGPITQKMLEDALHIPVNAFNHKEKVSGNMKVHYQPTTPTYLMSLQQIEHVVLQEENMHKIFGVMQQSDFQAPHHNVITVAMPQDKDDYARCMYSVLHDLDAQGVNKILIETPPTDPEWADINDRLSKAATSYDDIKTI